MVLRLKTRESRSLPGLPNATTHVPDVKDIRKLHVKLKIIFSSHDGQGRNKKGRHKRSFLLSKGRNAEQNEWVKHLKYGASLTGANRLRQFAPAVRVNPKGLLGRDKAEGFALARGGAAR